MTEFVQIGEPYPLELPGGSSVGWHPEASNSLIVAVPSPTEQELHDLSGPIELAVLPVGPLVVLLARIGHQWIDAPWAYRMDTPADNLRGLLNGAGAQIFLLVVVDSDDEWRVRLLRPLTASQHLSDRARRLVATAMASGRRSDRQITKALESYQATYPRPKDAVKDSSARCKVRDAGSGGPSDPG